MKAYFIDFASAAVPYKKEKHAKEAYKFLFWAEEGILLVGSKELKIHKWLHMTACSLAPERNPDGAGDMCYDDGGVTYWGSTGFQIETPEMYKPLILEVLGVKNAEKNLK